ncbi:HopJ type III effector protein [Aurantibacter crassamenti]|uniref:HopJ type III effector protein n=1 Tax=Aurantibacter crassamenti TaxID=1837375 RepID=UPI00193A4E9C|nr:HopJ type III effector protein [Aurantibacter crassamenti]MBM1105068.1 HopJ type III effector protein [Aurantibacter crassamenti]
MSIEDFKNKLKNSPERIEFTETMAVIDENYSFSPTAFTNGAVKNESRQNSGSCKLFAFAIQQGLSKEETLACFGQFFRDVQSTPEGTDHQNIRNFIKTGFEGLSFEGEALKKI